MTVAHKNFRSIFDDVCSNSFFEELDPLKASGINQWIFSDKINCNYLTSDNLEFQDYTGIDASRKPQPGRCYLFDGVDDYVTVADNNLLDFTNNFTICFWVNDTKSGTTSYLSKWYYPTNNRSYLIVNEGGLLVFQLSGDGAATYYKRFTSVQGTGFKHICFTFASGNLSCFVNGVQQTMVSQTGTAPTSLYNSTAALDFGRLAAIGTYYLPGNMRDIRFYNRVLSNTEIANVANNEMISNGLVAHYKCDEAAGATCYDSSGNGLNGTITNATLSNFHSTNINVNYSFQNEVGYSVSGSTLIPRKESDITKDVSGNNLQYSGKVKYPLKMVQSPCGNFDGVDDYMSVTSLTGSETVISKLGTATVTIASGRINFGAGTCYSLVLSNGSKYAFSEGSGATIYDISGNGRHGSLINTTEGNFWGQTQDVYHYNIINGFRLSGSVRIPALENHSNAADGNPITHTAGNWHNNATTKLKQYESPAARKADSSNFWFNGSTVNAKSHSDLLENTDNKIYCNIKNSNKKRNLMNFGSSLSSSDSYKIKKYNRS